MRRKKGLLAGLVLSACSLTSCVFQKHLPQDVSYAGPRFLPLESRVYYAVGSVPAFSETVIKVSEDEVLYSREIRLFPDKSVTFEYYRSKIFEKPPLVLVSPILGGDYVESRPVCELLAENGVSALLVHRPDDFSDLKKYATLEGLLLSIVRERRQALEVVVGSGEVDVERMGSFGLSMGAITNVPLVAVEPRLKFNIFGLVGGDVPSILLESSEWQIRDAVEKIVRESGEEGLRKYVSDGYRSDPLEMAPFIDARGVRMFVAYLDTVVPVKYGLLLRERMGCPATDVLPTGHYTTILYYFWIKELIVDFFHEKFGLDCEKIELKKEELERDYAK